MNKQRIAVVGSGISGLITAWLLKDHAEVSLFEADERFGGHSHTVVVNEPQGSVAIDTGFMVMNRPNYPLLSALFDDLDIQTYPTDMSFAVSLNDGALEYAGSSVNSLFAQRGNLISPSFIRMLSDIVRFNKAAKRLLIEAPSTSLSLQEFLDQLKLGSAFRQHYLYPMAAAIWSCPRHVIAEYPAASFVQFFVNHGLVNINDRPQWHTVAGGSSRYVARLIDDLGHRAKTNLPVTAVHRTHQDVELHFEKGASQSFDQVVFACHSDQTLALFAEASPSEKAMLSRIRYQDNRVILHSDPSLMPSRKNVWSSWNYLGNLDPAGEQSVSVTYWMNALQDLNTRKDYFVSLNPLQEPDPDTVVRAFCYQHPVFGADSRDLSSQLKNLQGRNRAWYCGAWTGYGFHEDGMRSGVEVAKALGAPIPWPHELAASQALSHARPSIQKRSEAA